MAGDTCTTCGLPRWRHPLTACPAPLTVADVLRLVAEAQQTGDCKRCGGTGRPPREGRTDAELLFAACGACDGTGRAGDGAAAVLTKRGPEVLRVLAAEVVRLSARPAEGVDRG